MKTILISFATKDYFKSQKCLGASSLRHGIDKVIHYNEIWLKKQKHFYQKNKSILDNSRGVGYWLWKPYIILHALGKMEDDDVLVYIDSGNTIVSQIKPLIDIAQERGLGLFKNHSHKNSTWTKRDCFFYMNADMPEYHDGGQITASYIVCKKTKFVVELMKEWLFYAQDERVISDNPNISGRDNLGDFKDHRHDQSILSILAIKYNIELFRDPSQWGNAYKLKEFRKDGEFLDQGEYDTNSFENSKYPTIIYAHRNKIKLTLVDKIEYWFKYQIQNYFKIG